MLPEIQYKMAARRRGNTTDMFLATSHNCESLTRVLLLDKDVIVPFLVNATTSYNQRVRHQPETKLHY